MTLLFFLISCSIFKAAPSLKSQDPVKLIDSVKLTGEGRGRLTLGPSQYVFSVDSVLKETHDWILAVTIPLHGEEVMILPDLKEEYIADDETESFEERIENEFQRLKLNQEISSEQFLKELRRLVRFQLSPAWGQKRDCKAQQKDSVCEYDGEKYYVVVTDKEIIIKKSLGDDKSLQLVAKNLTDSFFKQTDILLYTNAADAEKKQSSFSLELFW